MTQSMERPIVLSALVIVCFVTVAAALIARLLHPVQQLSYVATTTLTIAILASFVGIWGMRRWGVCLYSAAVSINLAILLAFGAPRWPQFAVPALILIAFAYYWRRMR